MGHLKIRVVSDLKKKETKLSVFSEKIIRWLQILGTLLYSINIF